MSYKHFDADKTRFASPAQPTNEAVNEKPSLFKGVSITQILATSLAAVTSFMLSNQIGVAGLSAWLLVLPHQHLLHRFTRTLLGVPRTNSAVVIIMSMTSKYILTATKVL